MNMNGLLLRSTVVAALGGLLFGFDTAVISGTTESLESVFSLNSAMLGFTVASALIGTITGSLAVGRPGDRWGRKPVLIILAVLYFVSALGSALAWAWVPLLLFRFIGGLAVGGASVMSPMYIAEISPARQRGRLVAVSQFNVVLGILLAFFSNYLLAGLMQGHENTWRWMFGVEALPAAAFFVLLMGIPPSPRWLISRGRKSEARAVLERLGEPDVDERTREIVESLDIAHNHSAEGLFSRKYLFPVACAVLLAMFNQLSGINALMYYAPRIFRMAGAGESASLLQSVAIGGTNLVFTILAMAVIDRFGRRRLMITGSLGLILCLGLVARAFYARDFSSGIVLFSLIGYIAFFAFSQGAVIWVFISEIFPNRVRARGQALGSFTHWFMAAVVSWTFPVIADYSGGHAFALFGIMMVLQLLFVLFMMPETKGVSLEEIQKKLGIE